MISDVNTEDERGRNGSNDRHVDMFVIHAALLLKLFLKGISGGLVLGLKGRKVILLNDPSEPPSWSHTEGCSLRFLGYSRQKRRPVRLVSLHSKYN